MNCQMEQANTHLKISELKKKHDRTVNQQIKCPVSYQKTGIQKL